MYCKMCGTKISEGSKYCTHCGCKISFEQSVIEATDDKNTEEMGYLSTLINRIDVARFLKIISTCMILGCFLPFCQVSICGSKSNWYIVNIEGGIFVLLLGVIGLVVANRKKVELRTKVRLHFWLSIIMIVMLLGYTEYVGNINNEGMKYLFGCVFCWIVAVVWLLVTYVFKKIFQK